MAATRAARVRAARARVARLRAARARRIRLERAARRRRRAARALHQAQVQPPPQTPVTSTGTPVTPTLVIAPAQPVLNGVEPYQLPDLTAGAAATSVETLLLPISTATAAPLLAGVSALGASTLRATAPSELTFPPSGGFNGASRFVMFLLGAPSIVPMPNAVPTGVAGPVTSRTLLLTPITGGRSQAAVNPGTRGGIGIETPLGRIAISSDGYVFGSVHYPLASVRGVVTTALISLGVLAAIAALLGAVGVLGRLRRGYGSDTREDLYAAARRKQIPGRSRMSKAELKRALDDR
jgi:hypothetical protein